MLLRRNWLYNYSYSWTRHSFMSFILSVEEEAGYFLWEVSGGRFLLNLYLRTLRSYNSLSRTRQAEPTLSELFSRTSLNQYFIKTRSLNYYKCKTILLQLENYLFLTTIVLTVYIQRYIFRKVKCRELELHTSSSLKSFLFKWIKRRRDWKYFELILDKILFSDDTLSLTALIIGLFYSHTQVELVLWNLNSSVNLHDKKW